VADNTLEYEFYVGPLRYQYTKSFDDHAYDVVEIGYALIRWFADPLVRYLIIPFFQIGSSIIPNYGILIILFGVIIKLVLYPLTQKSFKSMAAMKELQPQMQEIKEKYKDDPQKQQKETLALYKKAGVNPLGGCLPMLLQFPILITLFFFFQNSMIIRQEPFLWANDLSAPDYIFNLPFSIPFLGDQIGGFVLLMTAAMFLQTKLTGSVGGMGGGSSPSGGPNMKAFTYVLPFILLFVFNNFAAGLSLYYLVYNVLSAAQQVLIKKQTETPDVATNSKGKGRKGKK
jgi:YidC/Oxa1 family membrane protein insertase